MGESMNMDQQLPQFIHQIVDRLHSVEGIVAIALQDRSHFTAIAD